MSDSTKVKVFVRIKPTEKFADDVIELLKDGKSIAVHIAKDRKQGHINNQLLDWKFCTSGVLHNASQENVFRCCVANLVKQTLNGYNCTVFAYGETGSGKTFTMTGTMNNFEHRGIIPRALMQLYQEISERHEQDITVRISYVEIHQEIVRDLLRTLNASHVGLELSNNSVSEDDSGKVIVKGLSSHVARSEEEALNLLFEGEMNRVVRKHRLNKTSSRSHCIFTIQVESHSRTESDTKYTVSKLNLVDLAGSERMRSSEGQSGCVSDAVQINKSLSFLEQTFIALDDGHRKHFPFRQSNLTHLLKGAVGGKCFTVMIANIWGEREQIEETLSTLRFASRVMNITCEPAVCSLIDYGRLCKQYEKEILFLRQELAMYDTLTNRQQVSYEPLSDVQIADLRMQVRKFVDGDKQDIEIVNLRQLQELFCQFREIVTAAESNVEARLKEKYVLYEKGDVVERVQESGLVLPERSGLVGEPDGRGFAAGPVNGAAKLALPSAMALSKKKLKKQKDNSSADVKLGQTDLANSLQSPVQSIAEHKAPPCIKDVSLKFSLSRPSKEDAFLQFRVERGAELSRLLSENKEVLREKKIRAKDVTQLLNDSKASIDAIKEKLAQRCSLDDYEITETDDGTPIFDEEEYELLRTLQSSKAAYRSNICLLHSLRSDISYCEKIVLQCRQQLLRDFEDWYRQSFPVDAVEEGDSEALAVRFNFQVALQDDGETFQQKRKQVLMKFPESVAFHNARMQVERRRLLYDSSKTRPISMGINFGRNPARTLPTI